jgi:hypothetical protein
MAEPAATVVLNLGCGLPGTATAESLPSTADASAAYSVRLNDMRIADGSATGFRVFLNLPDATQQTPLTDDHYVTSAAFFPIPSGTTDGPPLGSFVISLERTLEKLRLDGETIDPAKLTLTVVPIGEPQAKIGFESSELVLK